MTIALLTLVCMLTYAFEIVFGLAGTIMMLMVMTAFVDARVLVVYSVMPQIMVAVIGLLRSPKTVRLPFLAGMLGFAAAGAVGGLLLFRGMDPYTFRRLLAGAIVAFGLLLVLGPRRLRLGPLSRRVLDLVAGASQALFGISGPIAMTRLLGSFDDKLVIRNYALAFFLSLNLLRAAGYLVQGSFQDPVPEMMAWSAVPLAASLWFANHLHQRVETAVFRRVVSWVILLGGVGMVVGLPGPG